MTKQDIFIYFKLAVAGVTPVICNFLGGWDIALKTLVVLTILDFVTGILAAIYLKQVSSNIGYKGVIKKIGLYIMVGIACLLDQMFNTQNILRSSMIGFYVSIEAISIVENWGRMELPLPDFIKKMLMQLRESSSSKGGVTK